MKTGIQLISEERQDQISKHNRSIESDIENNKEEQLRVAAIQLLSGDSVPPKWWSGDIWQKMVSKSYEERLIIAGALIAAEIDRMNSKSKVSQ